MTIKTNNNILKHVLLTPFVSLILIAGGESLAAQHYELPGAVSGETSNSDNSSGRYAHQHRIDINVDQDSEWVSTENGHIQWQAVFSSEGATSIELVFDQYHLPPSARLVIQDEYSSKQRGPYGQELNRAGTLSTPILETSRLSVTLSLAEQELGLLKLGLSAANIGFTPLSQFNTKGFGDSGSCHTDSVCSDIEEVSNAARATAMITVDGRLCTGVLLNNTANDGRPLFLTAHHCVSTAEQASKSVLYWNYRRNACESGGASLNDSQPGARLLATWELSDFSLLELNQLPPEEYNVYWAGWDASYVEPQNTYSLHHPRGDAMKMAVDNDAPLRTFYRSNHPSQGNHLRVISWDQGSTEAGSSGGGLWNENNLVVGQLHGGRAACGNDESDWYGWLAASWEGKGDCETSLKYWLDPDGALIGGENQANLQLQGTNSFTPPEFSYPFCRLTPDDAYEHNDDMEHAYFVPEDQLLRNDSGDGIQLDADWFTFTTEFEAKVIVDLLFQHGNGDLDLGLYDASGVMITEAISRDNNERITFELPAGDYFLQVKNGSNNKSADASAPSSNSYNLVWSSVKLASTSSDDGGGAIGLWPLIYGFFLLLTAIRRKKLAVG